MNERNVVDTLAECRHRITEPFTALAILAPTKRRIHHLVRSRLEELYRFARIKLLTMVLCQGRLVVPQIALARSPRHVELYDALRLRRITERISWLNRSITRQQPFIAKHTGERNAAQPAAQSPEKIATRSGRDIRW